MHLRRVVGELLPFHLVLALRFVERVHRGLGGGRRIRLGPELQRHGSAPRALLRGRGGAGLRRRGRGRRLRALAARTGGQTGNQAERQKCRQYFFHNDNPPFQNELPFRTRLL